MGVRGCTRRKWPETKSTATYLEEWVWATDDLYDELTRQASRTFLCPRLRSLLQLDGYHNVASFVTEYKPCYKIYWYDDDELATAYQLNHFCTANHDQLYDWWAWEESMGVAGRLAKKEQCRARMCVTGAI